MDWVIPQLSQLENLIYSQLDIIFIAQIMGFISILCYSLSKYLPQIISLWKETQAYKTFVVFWPFVWKSFSSHKFKLDVFLISICAIGVRITQPLIMKYQKEIMDTMEAIITKTKLRAQSFTSLMIDLHQDINRVSSFSRCLNGTLS